MRVCPSCGHENAPDVDFCENCGQYIRWEATSLAPAVKPAGEAAAATEAPPAPPLDPAAPAPPAAPAGAAPAATPAATPPAATPPAGDGDGAAAAVHGAVEPPVTAQPPPPEPVPEPEKPQPLIDPDSVVMDLGIPGVEVEGPVTVSVQAGGNARITLLIRNQSGIVDNYDITVQGLPDAWWTATPPTVYLVPYGTASDGYEQEVMIDLHPPRSAEAEARPWLIKVAAGSRAYEVEIGTRDATLIVEPYYELESEMRPERKSGRKKARFAMAIRNKANAPADIELTALDSENKITFDFERPTFPTKPGRRAGTVFHAKPLKQIWFGRKLEHRFTVNAQAVGAEAAAVPRLGVFVQKPWIPYWMLVVLPLLILAAIAAYLLWPRTTTVPNVRQTRKLLTAQHMLEQKGLKLGKVTEFKTDRRPPGSPINASPTIGSKVKKGSTIDLVLAVGTGLKIVPNVVGMNLADADAALKEAGFQVGQQTPAPSDPAQKVQKQVPVGNKKANVGSPIDLFFAEAKTTSSTTTTTTTTPTTTTPGEKKSTGVVVPGGSGSTATTTTTAPTGGDPLAKLGVVFDDDKDILIMGAKTGKPVKKLAATDELEQTPAVSPDGSLVAYARGSSITDTQIWTSDPKKELSARRLTKPGFAERHPAFSPDGKIIAFARIKKLGVTNQEDGDLCFIPVTASAGSASCIADPKLDVTRPAWSPDGKAILVTAHPVVGAKQIDLLEYTSSLASAGNADKWSAQGLVTAKLPGNGIGEEIDTAAWSPDGKQVAFSATWGSNAYHVVLVPAAENVLGKKVTSLVRVRACELAYLLSNELVINQRDNTCAQPGVIVRFDPSKPDKLTPLTKLGLGAEHPALSPTAP